MIRINLLGLEKKSKKVKRPTFTVSGGVNTTLLGVIIAGAAIGGNYAYYARVVRDGQKLESDLGAAKRENSRLAGVKTKYLERQKQFDLYDRRVKVIHQLQQNQTGPSELLNTVASTVNSTDAVWLNSMADDGNNINLDGMAISANAVANLIANLKKTNYFKSVAIKDTFQDESVKDMQAFKFSIVCEKQKS